MVPYRKWLVSLVLCGTLAGASFAADSSEGFALEYKATAAGLQYDYQNLMTSVRGTDGTTTQPQLTDIRELRHREVTASPDGTLSVAYSVLGDKVYDSELGRADTPDDGTVPQRVGSAMTKLGERLDPVQPGEPEACLAPVFPAGKIKPGHKWQTKTKLAFAEDTPVTVNHEFLEVSINQGMPVAIIVSDCLVKEAALSKGARVAVKAHGRLELSLTDGEPVLVYASVSTRATVPADAGPAQLRRDQVITMLRRTGDGPSGK